MARYAAEKETTSIRGLVASVVSTWRSGARPATSEVLRKYPQLKDHKTAILDLAYEEFWLRKERGEAIPISDFCTQFPEYQKSIRRTLNIHRVLEENGDALDEAVDRLASEVERERQGPINWPGIGDVFAQCQLVEELGKGAFARVFLAVQRNLGSRLIVLKISPHGAREADTIARLEHPNIVPVYSVLEDEATGLKAVCMPFLGRATLYDVLDLAYADARPRRADVMLRAAMRGSRGRAAPVSSYNPRPFPRRTSFTNAVVHLGVQLADALATTHDEGILHRDIKPSNVLLTPQGRPMLLDFNLSTQEEQFSSAVGGTLPYMPPEAILSVLSDPPTTLPADPRSDLFSLGVIVYELLTGTLPFGDPEANLHLSRSTQLKQAARLILERQNTAAVARSQVNAHIPEQLFDLLTRCMSVDVKARPSTATEIRDELDAFLSVRSRVRRWLARNPFTSAAAATTLSLSLGSAGFLLATRDAYDVRELRLGMIAYEAEDYGRAETHFENVLSVRSDSAEAYFARAQTLRQLEDFQAAKQAYLDAEKYSEHGLIQACIGYCHSMRDENLEAINRYSQAIQRGYDTADVNNNLGYSYLRLEELPHASLYLDKAIEKNSFLQVAFFNRSLVNAKISLQTRQGNKAGCAACLDQAAQDIEKAIGLGHSDCYLQSHAAEVYALKMLRLKDESARKFGQQHLEMAISLGLPKSDVAQSPWLSQLTYTFPEDHRDAPPHHPSHHFIPPPLNERL